MKRGGSSYAELVDVETKKMRLETEKIPLEKTVLEHKKDVQEKKVEQSKLEVEILKVQLQREKIQLQKEQILLQTAQAAAYEQTLKIRALEKQLNIKPAEEVPVVHVDFINMAAEENIGH